MPLYKISTTIIICGELLVGMVDWKINDWQDIVLIKQKVINSKGVINKWNKVINEHCKLFYYQLTVTKRIICVQYKLVGKI